MLHSLSISENHLINVLWATISLSFYSAKMSNLFFDGAAAVMRPNRILLFNPAMFNFPLDVKTVCQIWTENKRFLWH